MKNYISKLNTLLISASIITLSTSCTKENINNDIAETNITFSETSNANATGSCNNKPGDYNSFSRALKKMKLSRRINEGSDTSEWTDPENRCNTGYFAIKYRSGKRYMMMESNGEKNDRLELKLEEGKEQSLGNYSQMKMKIRLYNCPTDSSDDERGYTFAQLHNRGDGVERPFIRFDWTKSLNKIRLTVSHNEKKNEGDSSYDMVDYSQGNELEVTIKMKSDGKLWVKAKNLSQNKQKSKQITPSNAWKDNDLKNKFYYSTGPYQQAESSSSSSRPYILYLSLIHI